MLCASCKNKTSTDRCSAKALAGIKFCGKHARSKTPNLWQDPNSVSDARIIRIQKVWRGYTVRHWLKMAGPGVLKRSICHNDEELVTFDDKNSVNPFDYFAFEENGKVYWFDIKSIAQHVTNTLKPTNPYTREPLSFEARQRLRKLCVRRHRMGITNYHTSDTNKSLDEILNHGWTQVCQIVEENGFFDMSPEFFIGLNRTQLYIYLSLIAQDMVPWVAEHTSSFSRRKKYLQWIRMLMKEYANGIAPAKFSYISSRVLLCILNDSAEQYPVCFMIMSALHRL